MGAANVRVYHTTNREEKTVVHVTDNRNVQLYPPPPTENSRFVLLRITPAEEREGHGRLPDFRRVTAESYDTSIIPPGSKISCGILTTTSVDNRVRYTNKSLAVAPVVQRVEEMPADMFAQLQEDYRRLRTTYDAQVRKIRAETNRAIAALGSEPNLEQMILSSLNTTPTSP